MSRHNRERRNKRRQDRWRCRRCSNPFNVALADSVRGTKRMTVHVCGHCKAYHVEDGDGVRLMTSAEEFSIRCLEPEVSEVADSIPGDVEALVFDVK